MLGFNKKKHDTGVLPVFVHAMQSRTAYDLAGKVWQANERLVRRDDSNGKEFIHFAYVKPTCTVWLQRDLGRTDTFELVLEWPKEDTMEIYTIGNGASAGDDKRAREVLHRMLTVPSVLPASSPS